MTGATLGLALATLAAQLCIFGILRQGARPSYVVSIPLGILAVGGAAVWPVMAAIGEVFPVSALNWVQDHVIGGHINKLSLLLCFVPAFLPLGLMKKYL